MDVLKTIYKAVEEISHEEVMDLMKILIDIDTTVPPGNTYREYVDTISPYFEELGYDLEEVLVPDKLVKKIQESLEGPRVNLIASKNFGQDRNVSFYGHMDIVPATSDGQIKWKFPPFQATMIKSGKIFGRGTADMKGAMVGLIIALQIIENLNLSPKYNIHVLNCTDEELGRHPGIAYLAEKGYIKGSIFCMDSGIEPIIRIGFHGVVNLIVETFGRSCHSGLNYLGINALEQTIPILVELMDLKKKVEKRESINIPMEGRPDSDKQWNMTPMFNIDIIKSGNKTNIIPDYCKFAINRRIIPEENFEDVIREIERAIERGREKSKLLDLRITYTYDYPALKIDPKGVAVTRMKEVIKLVQNVAEENIKYLGEGGSTDMGLVSQILNTRDIIMHGPSYSASNPHGVNEVIRMSDLKTFIKELLVFLCYDF